MIFRRELVELIQQGKKSQTRQPVGEAGEECRYIQGRMYAVQPGRGQPAKLHITITEVRREKLGEISPKDAKREGFRNPIEFLANWREVYGEVDRDREVWVLSFCVGDMTDQPRLLAARPGGPGGDYTTIPSRAARGEPEAVSEAEGERYAQAARERDLERVGPPSTNKMRERERRIERETRALMRERKLPSEDLLTSA